MIARIVAGPSNSRVTLLPAIRGSPVACSSITASDFRSALALAQRFDTRFEAWRGASVPLVVSTVGVALAGRAGSTSGSVLQEARARPSVRGSRMARSVRGKDAKLI